MKRYIILFIILFLTVDNSFAQEEKSSIAIQFKADTARIESKYRANGDYTTPGMINACIELRDDYDALLNKYYKILLSHLNDEEKKILITSQRNWLKLRDSDNEAISMLRTKVYKENGGGTIWGVVTARARVDITRDRVIQLFRFIMFDYLGSY